jgi:hypothetical protein
VIGFLLNTKLLLDVSTCGEFLCRQQLSDDLTGFASPRGFVVYPIYVDAFHLWHSFFPVAFDYVQRKQLSVMKKIWLTIAGSLVFALAVNAQDRSSDTTGTGSTQSSEYQYQWRDEDREQVRREDLPSGLVETLEGTQYEGWENATIYRNKSSNDYMLVIQDNGLTRTFYFDQEGKERALNTTSDLSEQPEDSSMDQSRDDQSTLEEDSTSMSGSSSSSSMNSDNSGSSSPNSSLNTSSSTQTSGQTGNVSKSTSGQSDDLNRDDDDNSSTVNTSGQSTSTPTGNDTYQQGQPSQSDQTLSGQSSTATGTTTQTGSTTSADKSAWQSTDNTDASAAWSKEDRVVITTNDLPSSLLITLGDPKYKGWDNSTVYRNRKTNEYMIEIRDGSDTRTYYFDKNGKAVDRSSTPNDIDE